MIVRRVRPALVSWMAAAIATTTSSARAAEPEIAVQARDCGDLDTNEVALVLELELTDMAGTWEELEAPPVSLECAGDRIRITVDDPVTGKRLARSVPRPGGPVDGRERAIALAVSQLFLTSWLELLVPAERRAPMPEQPAPVVEAATDHARRAVGPSESPAPPPPAESFVEPRLSLLGGARLRQLDHPFVAPHAAVRVGLELDRRFALFAQAAFERGRTTRERGAITTWIGDFGVGAGWTPADNVAKWTAADGWEPIGAGIDGSVVALAVDPSGSPLYAAAEMNDTWQTEIHRWDGTDWSSIAVVRGDLALVKDMQVDTDGTLYVAGLFSGIDDDATIANFAAYDGTDWSSVGGNPDGEVSTVLVDATELCIGGSFTAVGATAAQNVACWNGTVWTAYGIPVRYHDVRVLARDDSGALLAGGHFRLDMEDEFQGHSIARWTGSSWEYIGQGVHSITGHPGYVEGIAVVGGDIYVAGYFNAVGPSASAIPMRDIAMWDGTAWHDLGGAHREMGLGVIEQNVRRMVADAAGNVFIAGMFTAVGDKNAGHVAMWDGTYWQNLPSPGQLSAGVNGLVNTVAARGDCGVYVAGNFRFAGDTVAHNIAQLDDSGFHPLGGGLAGDVYALAIDSKGTLYAGGDFVGPGFYFIGAWDGSAWSGIGNTMGEVLSLAVDDDDNLYVGGEFEVAGDVVARNVAMWDGTEWHALGDGLDGRVNALGFDPDGNLVAGGRFEEVDGVESATIAVWDGTSWSTRGNGLPGYNGIRSIVTVDGQLVVGGGFDALEDGGKGVAVWDGTEWTSLGGGLHSRYSWSSPYVNGLVPVGDVLFAVGLFTLEEGGDYVNAAYYDGTRWYPMGAGLNDIAEAAVGTEDGIYIGGTFTKADDTPSVAVALWRYDD